MIDITVTDDKFMEIDMKRYYFDYYRGENIQKEVVRILTDVIDKAKYSGETISLWKTTGESKEFVKEWP